jgi:hypothetical protein
MYTKCGWNPFAGRKVKGLPETTIVRGTIVAEDYGNVVGKPGFGEFITPIVHPTAENYELKGGEKIEAPPIRT